MAKITQIYSSAIIYDEWPLIQPGEYTFQYVSHSTWMMFGRRPKLVIEFSIVNDDGYSGIKLNKYYNVKNLKGKHGRNGNITITRALNFTRDYYRIFPGNPPKRLDRIPMSRFEGVEVLGKVITVTRGYDQKEIPEPLQYSVITEIFPCQN